MEGSLRGRIRDVRGRRGLTLRDLSAKTGLSVPYLSDIERQDETNPTIDALQRIAEALETTVADLLGGATEPQPRAIPSSLRRFIRTDAFEGRVKRLAESTGRVREELEREIVDFLAASPKRAQGELSTDDWRRLLDFYTAIASDD